MMVAAGIWRLLLDGWPRLPGAAAPAGGRGAARAAGSAGRRWWAASHGRAGGMEVAGEGVAVAPRSLPLLHEEAPPRSDLPRSVPAPAPGGCWRRPPVPAWRIWRVGEVPGETPGWRGGLPKVDAFGAGSLPGGFGVDPLPPASSPSYGESWCSPILGVDGTLVSCSFLKAAAGNCFWWRGC